MSRLTRTAAALVLAAATLALPILLDHCASACEDHQNSTPSCHHTVGAIASIGAVPSSCGHDHDGRMVAQVNPSTALQRMFHCAIVIARVEPIALDARLDSPAASHAPPGSSLTLQSHSLPLRI